MVNKTDTSIANQKRTIYAKKFCGSQVCLEYGAVSRESQVTQWCKVVKVGVFGQCLFELIS